MRENLALAVPHAEREDYFQPAEKLLRAQTRCVIFPPMFKLTKQEMTVVAFLVGALLVGSAVRQWRVHKENQKAAAPASDVRKP